MLTLRLVYSLPALVLVTALLSACGGGGTDSTPDSGRIDAADDAIAVENITRREPSAAGNSDINEGIILTRLDVVIDLQATAAQINAALDRVEGRIVTSRPGSPFVTIAVPRQSDAAKLRALAEQLTAMDGIVLASIGQEIGTRKLPDFGGTNPPVSEPFIDHLAEARFPAAWNASRLLADCASDPVRMIIVDKFGSLASLGNLGSTIAAEFPNYSLSGTVTDNGETHGWEVAAMAAAAFEPSQHTGAMPFWQCLDLNLFSVSALTTAQHLEAIELALRVLGPTAIVNYSLGFVDRCEPDCSEASLIDGSGLSDFYKLTPSYTRAWLTLKWKNLTRDLWDSFLVTAASGDESGLETSALFPALAMAPFSSVMNYAQLVDYLTPLQQDGIWGMADTPGFEYLGTDNFMMDSLIDADTRLDPNSTAPASNVMMVGNGDINSAFSSDSIVHVLANADQRITLSGTLLQDGSSLAAPQVAGLAAYLWALEPALRTRPMADTINAIVNNARELPHGRFIDAYATVLSLDKDTASEPPVAPVREAILDVNDDGYFNQDDLVIFANVFQLPAAASPDAGTQRGEYYSRFDLNGSGTIDPLAGTGGSTERFDLDPENSTYLGAATYSTVTLDFGNGNTTSYDENNLSDVQILCYYAYSTLYLGDELTRSNLLPNSVCGGSGWQTPQMIDSGTTGVLSDYKIAVDANGNAIAVISKSDATNNGRRNIWSNRYDVNTGWGTAQLIETNAGDATSPQIRIDSNGNAIAFWVEYTYSDSLFEIWTNRYDVVTGWGTAQLIETGLSGFYYSPRVNIDMNKNGNAIAVWDSYDGTRVNIWSSYYVPGTGWGTAQLIETNNTGHVRNHQISMDGSGNVIAVWQQYDGTRDNIWSSRYVSGSGWEAAQLIETDDTGHARSPQISMDSSGNAIAVWQQAGDTTVNISSNHYIPGVGWGTAQFIDTIAGSLDGRYALDPPQISMNSSGSTIAVWSEVNSTGGINIWSNRYGVATGWGTAQIIDTAGNAYLPLISVDNNGNAIAVWVDGVPQNTVWSNRYVVDKGWDGAQIVSDSKYDASWPQIAFGSDGRAFSIWRSNVASDNELFYSIWSP